MTEYLSTQELGKKPKMQLSEDAPVTPGFRIEMNKWMEEFFGYEDQAIRVFDDVTPKATKVRRKRGEKAKDLGDLLDNIGETFKLLEFDIDNVTFYRMLKEEVVGLKKCAPLVTDSNFMHTNTVHEKADPSRGLPAYFVISVNQGASTDEDTLQPDFAFGMRVKKVPWNVTRMQGTVYLFGMAWRDGKKHIWHGFWLSVLPDGTVRVADELQEKYVSVGGSFYTKKVWDKSSWHGPQQNRETSVRHCFCEALSRYQTRKDKWNIGVSNGKKRIVFLIPDNEAKDYFKGRNKVVTENGRTKPIIHFVKAHTQQHGHKMVPIPEHIRGLREFEWSGYKCAITAPQFHAYSAADLELPGDQTLDVDPKNGVIGIGELADMMNSYEDSKQDKVKKAKK